MGHSLRGLMTTSGVFSDMGVQVCWTEAAPEHHWLELRVLLCVHLGKSFLTATSHVGTHGMLEGGGHNLHNEWRLACGQQAQPCQGSALQQALKLTCILCLVRSGAYFP